MGPSPWLHTRNELWATLLGIVLKESQSLYLLKTHTDNIDHAQAAGSIHGRVSRPIHEMVSEEGNLANPKGSGAINHS